jgi:hypothetical protein
MGQSLSEAVTVEQIATTEDTNDPVFEATAPGIKLNFLFPPNEPQDMWIHYVRSEHDGGMSAVLDYLCSEYECTSLRFLTPLNDHLPSKLHGYELKTIQTPRGLTDVIDVEWDPDA